MMGSVMDAKLSALIVVGSFHTEVCGQLVKGAIERIKAYNAAAECEVIEVPGALEIPPAISFAVMSDRESYDGFVALGCVLKGYTDHNIHVSNSAFSALSDIAVQHAVPMGTGIITADTMSLAMERADVNGINIGGRAAAAMLRMLELYRRFLG
ncbi:6,7-dimethyl-8-ribityllumazine synthase [Anaplasma phagocytophilum str. Webster]|nr:6,7-dimethyl-8-ribityllumazine synthase [Anaplasma phagocytophilum str. Webster]